MLLALLLTMTQAHAGQWLCTEEASQRMGDSIYACGIGLGKTEDAARAQALERAAGEFKSICDLTDTCRAHAVTATPKRTECTAEATGFKCYRGVLFTPSALSAQVVAAEGPKLNIPAKAKAQPRLRKGMTMQEVLNELGEPKAVGELSPTTEMQSLVYDQTTKGCKTTYLPCIVLFRKGQVEHLNEGWDYRITDRLH